MGFLHDVEGIGLQDRRRVPAACSTSGLDAIEVAMPVIRRPASLYVRSRAST
ncbi:hypothetical protein QE394_000277 [Arthrobacter sp. SORGH_AS 212]|nr:hypothetical protein [Arthrobacter sp. SORGH_AS_0212]